MQSNVETGSTNYCIDKNDYVKPVYDVSENKFFESDKEWSLTSSSYHTKIATGLINLYSVTKQKYLENAKKICNRSLQFQTKNGRFISFPFREEPMHILIVIQPKDYVCRYLFKGEKVFKSLKKSNKMDLI